MGEVGNVFLLDVFKYFMLAQPVLLSLLTHTFQREKSHADVQNEDARARTFEGVLDFALV